MNFILFLLFVCIAIYAGFNILKSLSKGIKDAHNKTVEDLKKQGIIPSENIETLSSKTGHTSIVKNKQDNKEYIVSTTRLDKQDGASSPILQSAVFNRTDKGDIYSTKLPPLIFFNCVDGRVAATTDRVHLSYIKLPLPLNHFSDKQFHDLITRFIKDNEKTKWKDAIRQFNIAVESEETKIDKPIYQEHNPNHGFNKANT